MYVRRSPRRIMGAEAERIPLLHLKCWRKSMGEVIYRLVSVNRKRTVESPFCLLGERIAAFYFEEAALKMARILRVSDMCRTVYGCYLQPDGSYLIGPASACRHGKYCQTLRLQEVEGTPDASVEVWKSVTAKRVAGPLEEFARTCLRRTVSQSQR